MLPKDKLYAMGKIEAVQEYVKRSDFSFYQALVEVLIPDVLRPIPSAFSISLVSLQICYGSFEKYLINYCDHLLVGSLTQAIRNFAKSLEGWLKGAMTGVPDEIVKTKVRIVNFAVECDVL